MDRHSFNAALDDIRGAVEYVKQATSGDRVLPSIRAIVRLREELKKLGLNRDIGVRDSDLDVALAKAEIELPVDMTDEQFEQFIEEYVPLFRMMVGQYQRAGVSTDAILQALSRFKVNLRYMEQGLA